MPQNLNLIVDVLLESYALRQGFLRQDKIAGKNVRSDASKSDARNDLPVRRNQPHRPVPNVRDWR